MALRTRALHPIDPASPRTTDTTQCRRIARGLALVLATLCIIATPAGAGVIWDESVDGDLSSDETAPTPLGLSAGSNVVRGTVENSSDVRDYMAITIPEGLALARVLLLDYSDAGDGGPGDRGYYALNAGGSSFVPSSANATSFLGGQHLDPMPSGTDLLEPISDGGLIGGLGAPGFEIPLPAGTYTFLVQQTGPEVTMWELDFRVVPEPSTAMLVALGVAGLARHRARHDA